jgi:Na+-transporting NADH:ubiquinone oxidoreductase subunit A
VALQGADYPDIRPKLSVVVGDRVRLGQTLFVDRHRPRIAFTAPSSGTVRSIDRGARRSLTSLVIDCERDDEVEFDRPKSELTREQTQECLLSSGLWPAFITRPFGRIPNPDTAPAAIFVTAMDTNPLAADASAVLALYADEFRGGLEVIRVLTDGPVYVCQAPGKSLAGALGKPIESVTFRGPHPAGLPGTHIHHLAATGGGRVVWHINYQDVIAVGKLGASGRLWTDRIISLAGPGVRQPALMQTRIGADIDELVTGKLKSGDLRIISGSVLSGRVARYLGRYHQQISVLYEGSGAASGSGLLSRLWARHGGTSLNGRPGPLIPNAALDGVMPLQILAVPLLRALSVGDVETAEKLGCVELIEEDVALLSHVCPSKSDYGPLLRQVLDAVEGEGA